jgi:hypothetical protein
MPPPFCGLHEDDHPAGAKAPKSVTRSCTCGTANLLIRRHGRVAWSGRMKFALFCSSGCLDAGLSSSLSSRLSSVIGCQIAARRRSMT